MPDYNIPSALLPPGAAPDRGPIIRPPAQTSPIQDPGLFSGGAAQQPPGGALQMSPGPQVGAINGGPPPPAAPVSPAMATPPSAGQPAPQGGGTPPDPVPIAKRAVSAAPEKKNQLYDALVGKGFDVEKAYDQWVEKFGGFQEPKEFSKKDKALFLMEFGMRMMASAANVNQTPLGAAGEAGVATLQGMRGEAARRKESALAQNQVVREGALKMAGEQRAAADEGARRALDYAKLKQVRGSDIQASPKGYFYIDPISGETVFPTGEDGKRIMPPQRLLDYAKGDASGVFDRRYAIAQKLFPDNPQLAYAAATGDYQPMRLRGRILEQINDDLNDAMAKYREIPTPVQDENGNWVFGQISDPNSWSNEQRKAYRQLSLEMQMKIFGAQDTNMPGDVLGLGGL